MHSKLYNQIKKYYDLGLYTKEQVKVFVDKKKITQEEYIEIVGTE